MKSAQCPLIHSRAILSLNLTIDRNLIYKREITSNTEYLCTTMIFLTVVIVIFIVLFKIIKDRMRFKKLMDAFPGRTDGHWLFGDMGKFSTNPAEIFQEFRKFNREFPKGFKITTIWHSAVCINTPEYAEVLLSSSRYIKKSLAYKNLHPWLKTGLLTSTGKKWLHRRKLLTPAFHFNILKKLTNNFEEHNQYLLELLKEESRKEKTDVVPIISSVALNIICGTSMGVSLSTNDKKNDEYRQAIYAFPEIITQRVMKPWLLVDFLFRLHPLFQYQKKLLSTLHGFTTDIIKKRDAEFDENEFDDDEDTYMKKKMAMLDLLLFAKRKRGEIDDEGIREEVDTFTFEGHDTVSMALSFALMLIANHKEHQKKIIQEIDEIFGDSDRNITYQDLQSMQYLELCLKESLRLYPSVPFISRKAEEDIPLDANHVIPNTAFVHVHIYDLHRNKEYFPDPEKFDPNRFLPENSKNRHPYAYIPFSAGPRNCIGQKYAMLEMKSLMATILRNYELEAVDTPETLVLSMEMVMRSKNGVHVKFVPRNK